MPSRVWTLSRAGIAMAATVAISLGAPLALSAQQGDTTHRTPAADNTKRNLDHQVTAQNQSKMKSDMMITRDLRRAIVKDTAMSTYARNVKIITMHGSVTLKGPVRSADEKAMIETKAKATSGVVSVVNQLTIAPKKH